MAESDGGFVRNFRSAYYEKVGFCGIEEEKVLDAIVSSSPLDIEKLGDFCSRFDLARRREEAWKLLLGVQCNSKNPFDLEGKVVTSIRAEHFELLKRHVEHLLRRDMMIKERLIQLCSTKSQLQPNNDQQQNKSLQVTLMYLLESGKLHLRNVDALCENECRILSNMASIFVSMSSNLQTAFFMYKSFLKKLEQNKELLNSQYKQSLVDLAKDMPELDRHIRSLCNFDDLPCWYWFRYCFIDILDEKATLRLWDKIISGCLKCLPRVFNKIFAKLEIPIKCSDSPEAIRRLLTDKDKFCLREFPQNSQS